MNQRSSSHRFDVALDEIFQGPQQQAQPTTSNNTQRIAQTDTLQSAISISNEETISATKNQGLFNQPSASISKDVSEAYVHQSSEMPSPKFERAESRPNIRDNSALLKASQELNDKPYLQAAYYSLSDDDQEARESFASILDQTTSVKQIHHTLTAKMVNLSEMTNNFTAIVKSKVEEMQHNQESQKASLSKKINSSLANVKIQHQIIEREMLARQDDMNKLEEREEKETQKFKKAQTEVKTICRKVRQKLKYYGYVGSETNLAGMSLQSLPIMSERWVPATSSHLGKPMLNRQSGRSLKKPIPQGQPFEAEVRDSRLSSEEGPRMTANTSQVDLKKSAQRYGKNILQKCLTAGDEEDMQQTFDQHQESTYAQQTTPEAEAYAQSQEDDRNINLEIMEILETSHISADLKEFHGKVDAEQSVPLMQSMFVALAKEGEQQEQEEDVDDCNVDLDEADELNSTKDQVQRKTPDAEELDARVSSPLPRHRNGLKLPHDCQNPLLTPFTHALNQTFLEKASIRTRMEVLERQKESLEGQIQSYVELLDDLAGHKTPKVQEITAPLMQMPDALDSILVTTSELAPLVEFWDQKTLAWENEIRDLQDASQRKQFQIDRLKEDYVQQVLQMSEQGGHIAGQNPRRLQLLLEQRAKDEAAASYHQNIIQNTAVKTLQKIQEFVQDLNVKLLDYVERKGIQVKDLPDLGDLDLSFNIFDTPASVHQLEKFKNKYEKQSLRLTLAFEALSRMVDENEQIDQVLASVSKASLNGYFEMGIKLDKLVVDTEKEKNDEQEEPLRQSISKELKVNLRQAINDGLRELQSLQVEEGFGPKFTKHFQKYMNSAREQFIINIESLHSEMKSTRTMLIDLNQRNEALSHDLKLTGEELSKTRDDLTRKTIDADEQKVLLRDAQRSQKKLQEHNKQLIHSLEVSEDSLTAKILRLQEESQTVTQLRAQISNGESEVIEHRSEIRKLQALQREMQDQLEDRAATEKELRLEIQKQQEQIEAASAKDVAQTEFVDNLLSDVQMWMSDFQASDEQFAGQTESLDKVESKEKLVSRLKTFKDQFKGHRDRLRSNGSYMQKQINEYRASLSPEPGRKSHSRLSSAFKTPEQMGSVEKSEPASNQKRSEAEVQSVNQELRMRLDCMVDEKQQLEMELKSMEGIVKNRDEYKKKVDSLQAKLLLTKQRYNEILDRMNQLVEKGDSTRIFDELIGLIQRMPREPSATSSLNERRGGSVQLSKIMTNEPYSERRSDYTDPNQVDDKRSGSTAHRMMHSEDLHTTMKVEIAVQTADASTQAEPECSDVGIQAFVVPDTPSRSHRSEQTTKSQHLYRLQPDDLSMFFDGAPMPREVVGEQVSREIGDVVFNVQQEVLHHQPDPESREHTLANTPDHEQAQYIRDVIGQQRAYHSFGRKDIIRRSGGSQTDLAMRVGHTDSINLSKIEGTEEPSYFAEERDLTLRSNPQNKTQESIENSSNSQKQAPPEIVQTKEFHFSNDSRESIKIMDQQQALNTTPDWRQRNSQASLHENEESPKMQRFKSNVADINTPLPGEDQASSSLQRMDSLLGNVDDDRLEQDMARIERQSRGIHNNLGKRKTVDTEMTAQIMKNMPSFQRSLTPGGYKQSQQATDMLILEDSKEQEQIQNEMHQAENGQGEGFFNYDANEDEQQQVDLDIDQENYGDEPPQQYVPGIHEYAQEPQRIITNTMPEIQEELEGEDRSQNTSYRQSQLVFEGSQLRSFRQSGASLKDEPENMSNASMPLNESQPEMSSSKMMSTSYLNAANDSQQEINMVSPQRKMHRKFTSEEQMETRKMPLGSFTDQMAANSKDWQAVGDLEDYENDNRSAHSSINKHGSVKYSQKSQSRPTSRLERPETPSGVSHSHSSVTSSRKRADYLSKGSKK